MSAQIKPTPPDPVAEAARALGRRGGRPRGSFSPLGAWLRTEAQQRQREGYRCREAFRILANTEHPDGDDAFIVTDHTADSHSLDIGARVTWDWFKKIWKKAGGQKPLIVPFVRTLTR